MLKYELILNENGKIIYRYFPEGNDEFGEVIADLNGNIEDIILGKSESHDGYAIHMASKIREFAKNNSFLESGIIAWG